MIANHGRVRIALISLSSVVVACGGTSDIVSEVEPATSVLDSSTSTTTPSADRSDPPQTADEAETAADNDSTADGSADAVLFRARPLPTGRVRSDKLAMTVEFDVPDSDEAQWHGLFEDEWSLGMLLWITDPTTGIGDNNGPGLVIATAEEGISAADYISSLLVAAPWLDLATEEGRLLGRPVTVLSGQSRPEESEFAIRVEVTDQASVWFNSSPREILAYVFEEDSRPVIIIVDGPAEDFDQIVTKASRVIETIEFVSSEE